MGSEPIGPTGMLNLSTPATTRGVYSTLVIASYGNLCFEALSYNASLGIIGQKSFQIEYANLLEKKKIALSIWLPSQLGVINV